MDLHNKTLIGKICDSCVQFFFFKVWKLGEIKKNYKIEKNTRNGKN